MTASGANVTHIRRREPQSAVKVIALTGGKGGIGKTTISANIALALAGLGRQVLLLDGDLGLANASLMFGLLPAKTLRDVVHGDACLQDVMIDVASGLKLIPGACGFADMAHLSCGEYGGIIRSFGDLEDDLDVMIVDTAPGIGDSVIQFAGAAHRQLVILRNDPSSMADAYAIIKLLFQQSQVDHVDVITNMTRQVDGERLYRRLQSAVEQFLPVTLSHVANIPDDPRVAESVRRQVPVMRADPRSQGALALRRLAYRIDSWELPVTASGRMEFFVERLLAGRSTRMEVAS